MGKRMPLIGKKLVAGMALFCVPMLLISCFTAGDKTSDVTFPQEKSPEDGQRKKVEGRNYVYNRPHAVPSDYVYRTERIFPAPNESAGSWWPFSGGPGSGGEEVLKTKVTDEQAVKLIDAVRSLASQLMRSSSPSFEEDQRLIVSTFVNLNDLYRTSAFGRFLGEQMANELRGRGLELVDVRKTPNILIRQKYGEYGMSRDMEELPFIHESHAIVVGTYSIAADQVFLNARVLRNSDGFVIASGSEVLRKDILLSSMLEDESVPVEKSLHTVQIDTE